MEKKHILFTFLLFLIGISLFAGKPKKKKNGSKTPNKFSHDAGFMLGGAYYLGELNPSKHFYMSQPALGIFYRFNQHYRLSYRVGLNFGSIMGDDSQSDQVDQISRNLNFKNKIQELSCIAEFNFWDYRISHPKKYFAPYIFLGFALLKHNPMGEYKGRYYDLQPLCTEGQDTPLREDASKYKLVQFTIPFGIGAKLNVSKNVGLSFEWGMRKTYTDYLDDVSTQYVNTAILSYYKGGTAGIMSDRSLDKDPAIDIDGSQRGNPNIKDWYNFFGFQVSIQLHGKERCVTAR
ncbi:MAG: DUF6089 family protein [Bacteroidota bacterium]|jgi:hypothetical protein